uniref:carbonyl reductase (NADPH) n=1 Tax=Macaca mulatta TaxID=9544 RepID=A0A5F7ZM34_MACMU
MWAAGSQQLESVLALQPAVLQSQASWLSARGLALQPAGSAKSGLLALRPLGTQAKFGWGGVGVVPLRPAPRPPLPARGGAWAWACACALSGRACNLRVGAPRPPDSRSLWDTRRASPGPEPGLFFTQVSRASHSAMKSGIRVALVTGGNKGIGLAIVRDLCRLFSGEVVLTARDVARGQAAVQQLQAEGLSPRFHQLDIDDPQSIRTLRDFLLKEYGGLDVLVNNAGIAFKVADPTPFHIQAEVTMKTNFFGTRDVCTELLPLIKPQGRVVNISSLQCLRAFENCSEDLQEKFHSDTLTEGDLVDLMKKFVEDTKNEVHEREGWPSSPYGVSKLGVTVLSRILARRLDEKRKADRILVNACCPGPVQTDMDGKYSIRTVEEGAESPVYLALLPPDATEPQGQLVHDKVVQNW